MRNHMIMYAGLLQGTIVLILEPFLGRRSVVQREYRLEFFVVGTTIFAIQ
jgi:hypothetical protein